MGTKAQELTPQRTTLLEAVNGMLQVIGELPVNSLDTQQIGEAAMAEQTLLEIHKEGQTRGWSWNREYEYPFPKDAEGVIRVPDNVISWAPSPYDYDGRYQLRGSRVYDRQRRTFILEPGIQELCADIVSLLPWDDCPEAYNRWAGSKAARVFAGRVEGIDANVQLAAADESSAWNELLAVEYQQTRPNALTARIGAMGTYDPGRGLLGRWNTRYRY